MTDERARQIFDAVCNGEVIDAMTIQTCNNCGEDFDVAPADAEADMRDDAGLMCPTCVAEETRYRAEEEYANRRERGDDDGVEYGHPGDEIADRLKED